MKKALVWLRRDLRLSDSTAFYEANKQTDQVSLVFVFDTEILKKLSDKNDKRITYIFKSLEEIKGRLNKKGSDLIVRYGNPAKEILKVFEDGEYTHLFFNRDYEPYAVKRDNHVAFLIEKSGGQVCSFKDHVIFESHEVLKDDGKPYSVYTPYKNKWLASFQSKLAAPKTIKTPNLSAKKTLSNINQGLSWSNLEFNCSEIFVSAGESAAIKQLNSYKQHISEYAKLRDIPADEGTSEISPHLRFGTVSTRAAFRLALSGKTKGHKMYLSELIWREFYQMILHHHPRVEKECFKSQYNDISWPGKLEHFNAWKDGKTGYPIIDAAMKKFARTGLMHNRLRMLVASFLVKDLLINWQKGESYFAEKLMDFDLAANNGGWQWCASTGCDAQPYFRFFNPVTQGEKFDPDAEFVLSELPQLETVSKKRRHSPWTASDQELGGLVLGKDYPHPIVNHKVQRTKAIGLFKEYR